MKQESPPISVGLGEERQFQHLIDNGDQPLGKAESDGLETIGVVSPKKCIDA